MGKTFKKTLVKMTSVGMSVAMAATPLTVLAEENQVENEKQTQETIPAADDVVATSDGEVKAIESETPVADEIREVADSLVDTDEPVNETENETEDEIIDESVDETENEASDEQEVAQTVSDTETTKTVEENLTDSQNALYDLADEVAEVEIANNAAAEAVDTQDEAEEAASKEASEAEAAAEAADANPTAENIAVAASELNEAADALEEAAIAKEEADAAVETAIDKLANLLIKNGLTDMTKEELVAWFAEHDVDELETITADSELDGKAKDAVDAAKAALEQANSDAENAANTLTNVQNQTITKIAVLKEQIANGVYPYENSYWRSMDQLANLLYTYYLEQNVEGYDAGSAEFVYMKEGLEVDEYYTVVKYTVNGEEKEAVINYTSADKEAQSSDLTITTKIITEGVTDYDNLIKAAVEGMDAVYEYQNADGVGLSTISVKGQVTVDDDTKIVVAEGDTAYKTDIQLESNQEVIGETTSTFELKNNTYTTVTTTDKQHFTDKEQARKAYEDAVAAAADNQTVTLNVTYTNFLGTYTIDVSDVNGWEEFWSSIYGFFGGTWGLNFTLSTTTTTQVAEVEETVRANVIQTDTYTDSGNCVPTIGWGSYTTAESNAHAEAQRKIAEWQQTHSAADGWSASYYVVMKDLVGFSYDYVITYTHVYTVNNVVVSVNTYTGTEYNNTLVSAAVAAEDALYGTMTTYEDGDKITATADNRQAISEASQALSDAADADTSAKAAIEATSEKLVDVVNAINEIFALKKASALADSNLEVISSVVVSAAEKLSSAVDKYKASQNQGGNQGGASTGGTTAGTTAATTSDTIVTIASSILPGTVALEDEQVPLAGPTNTTTRRARTTAATNVAADANADSDAVEAVAEVPEVEEDEDLEMIDIQDEGVAKAGQTREESKTPGAWLWGLILALLAAAGFTTYKVTKAKKAKAGK